MALPERQTFTDPIELGRRHGLWAILARILIQPLAATGLLPLVRTSCPA